jgi:hypothetical protein
MGEALEKRGNLEREGRWSDSIEVASEGFVRRVKEDLRPKAMWREVAGAEGTCELREPTSAYGAVFEPENGDLRGENAFSWDISV